ncbi:MAG: hypothetical protein K6G68_05635 [Oscillospiraceae bacterium]|nr:hypothetical protein [Oscillospiraceae bacterium]
MNNKRDERENSLNRKKLRFAQKHEKKKHYHIAKPATPGKQAEPEDTVLSAALDTLVGGHHDTMRRFTSDGKRDNAHDYDTTPDTEKHRQMQKARFIQQQLTQEEHRTSPADTDDYVTSESTLHYDSRDEYSAGKQAYSDNDYGNDTYDSVQEGLKEEKAREQQSPDNTHRLTETEKAVIESKPTMTVAPETIDRMRKAQYLKEQLERQSVRSAAVEYYDDHTDEIHHNDVHTEPKTDKDVLHNTDGQDDIIYVIPDAVSAVSDELKADIQRAIKRKQYESKHDIRRQEADDDAQSNVSIQTTYYSEQHYSDDEITAGPEKSDVLDEVSAAVGYVQSVQTADAQKIVVKPITDTIKRHLSDTSQTAVDGATTITSSVQGADSTQAVPFNIGMVLAENEAKKLAYKMAKGEDILAEKEQAHVQERIEQSKYRFVEPDKHKPKVEKRESIREEQKRKFVKDSEIKKQAARKEAEQKAKEGIFIKSNKREDGLIGKIFSDEKKYHPKGKGALIAAAAGGIFPVILILVVIMFICALFAWASPHKENIFDESSGKYKEEELTGEEVITGYVKVVKDIYDEKQLEILAMITKMNCDHEMLDNKWIKLDENFDIESIIAIEATKKWRELQDSMAETEDEEEAPEETEAPTEEDAEDIIYHLTREDFEEVVEMTFNFDARAETRVCDQCAGEQQVEYDPETGEFYIITTPCVHKFLMGAGVNNLVSLVGHEGNEYYFFDKVFDKESETYEEDKMMYDLYKEVLQKNILGTTDEPSHTIVDYSGYSQDYQRMMRVAQALGYTIMGDKVVKQEDS